MFSLILKIPELNGFSLCRSVTISTRHRCNLNEGHEVYSANL